VQTDWLDAPNAVSSSSWAAILGREAAIPRPILIPGMARRRVLVTGAGGFIGAEMVRILAASGAARIVLLEIAEQPLFAIAHELEQRGYGDRCVPILGNVCDRALLHAVFDEHRPEIVLHAAALKHVPLMERNPLAAVSTNSIGTWLLAQIAAEREVRRMIFVSTDKAVAPHSIMGASKRIAELAMLVYPQYTTVRLVNVIGSPGSVAPLFAEQIAAGGPVTVTDAAASRFFLTLDQVAALLAGAVTKKARGLLVPDSGEPVSIEDLAHRMIAASGRDIRVVVTGPRPGDKSDESLLAEYERDDGPATTGLRRVISPTIPDLDNYIAGLASSIATRDLPVLLHLVQELVPDYEPSVLLRDSVTECPPQ